MSTTEPRADYDRQTFRRVALMTIVWVILLVIAGWGLVTFGDVLSALFA